MVDSGEAEAELNRFLASHRVASVDRQWVSDGQHSAWALCVTYVGASGATTPASAGTSRSSKRSVDYREVLSAEDFEVFSNLRTLRKQAAEREGVPVYAVFTNEQLAAMVRTQPRTANDLGRLPGVGPARVDKYGAECLAALARAPTTSSKAAIDGLGLQAGYDAALAITAHARARGWRRAELRHRPAMDA